MIHLLRPALRRVDPSPRTYVRPQTDSSVFPGAYDHFDDLFRAGKLTQTTPLGASGQINRDGEIDLSFPRTIMVHAEHGEIFGLDVVLVRRIGDG